MSGVTPEDVQAAFEQIFAAQRRLRGRDAKVVDGISMAQSRLLRTLTRNGALPVGQLAARLAISPASATQLIDGLETRGLIGRNRSDDDRRIITIGLTEDGRRRAEETREQHLRLFTSALAGLSADELAGGHEVLRRCIAYLDSL